MKSFLLAFVLLALASSLASAFDPDPLGTSVCEWEVTQGPQARQSGRDFYFSIKMQETQTIRLVQMLAVHVDKIPGLNTLGISLPVLTLLLMAKTHLTLTLVQPRFL
ncbi:hypothetical protein Pint_20329 [Pistacia integerrima]|uniref:Uncharacterized protein n=1 Tax=Pistacia integerrima TaxID=434235 RepID=A0ACC0XBI6_9ROSI|nr:hypothetical protein Pint_20329 [Pistacia integerrima]